MKRFLSYLTVFLVFANVMLLACTSDEEVSASLPTVTTAAISAINQTTATSGGNVTSDGGATITARGICW